MLVLLLYAVKCCEYLANSLLAHWPLNAIKTVKDGCRWKNNFYRSPKIDRQR